MTSTVFILNGPNLNLLGTREPEIYGPNSLSDIEDMTRTAAKGLGVQIEFRQSNQEGDLIDWIHEARDKAAGLIINAASYSHTSIGILDALNMYDGPVVEVHLSNIFKREAFRHHSYISGVADGVICGLGAQGYVLALNAVVAELARR